MKTSPDTSHSGSTLSPAIYKELVTTLRQGCLRRLKWVRVTNGNGSSLSRCGPALWATPRAQVDGCQTVDGEPTTRTQRWALSRLENQAKYWRPPATTGNGSLQPSGSSSRGPAARWWPTSAARDAKGAAGPNHLINGTGRKHLDQLPNFVTYCLPPDWSRIDCESSGMASFHYAQLMHSSFWRLLTLLEARLKAERKQFLF